jgi:hypothetical protein
MTRAETIREALGLYKKYGWTLRRVLLSEQSRRDLESSLPELFGPVEITGFEKDAAWFSRASAGNTEAWELRLFGDAPFALVEVFDAEQDEAARDLIRRETERRLLETIPVKPALDAEK